MFDNGIKRFGIDGKFKNTISKKGKGPEEYIEFGGFEIDKKTGVIYLMDYLKNSFSSFTLNGDFIGNEIPKRKTFHWKLYDDEKICYLYGLSYNYNSDFNSLLFTDRNGKETKTLLPQEKLDKNELSKTPIKNSRLYYFHDSLTVWEGYTGIIYRLTNNYNLIPKYKLLSGKNGLPNKLDYNYHLNFSKVNKQYLQIIRFIESNNHFFFEISDRGGIPRLLIYNKTTNDITCVPEMNSVINDYDGGMAFWPDGMTRDGRHYKVIQLYRLKDHFKKPKPENLKYPEKYDELKRMVDSSHEDDNPIIMLVKLK